MKTPTTEPLIGIFPDILNATYHAAEDGSFSSSIVKECQTPLKAYWSMNHPSDYKECFRLGSAIHKYVLERPDFEAEFLTGIDCGRRSNADRAEWAAWFYAHGADGDHIVSHSAAEWNRLFMEQTGKYMVSPEELATLRAIAEAVAANKSARMLLEDGLPEQSVYWVDDETGLRLRCRPDYLNTVITDLKSTRSAEEREFMLSAHKLGYHISAAMYQDGLRQVTGDHHRFLFIAVEKTPPYLNAVYQFDESSSELGYNIYRRLLRRLANCMETDCWPGLDNNLDISLPHYAFGDFSYDDD